LIVVACQKKAELAQTVVEAVARVYESKRRQGTAKVKGLDAEPFNTALAAARAAELEAVKALEGHRKLHGC
jgi:hypothetical protein